MNVLKRYKNMRPLFSFTAALLLFLTIGVTLSISRQRTLLLEQENAHMDREFSLLEAVISDDLLKHDYAGIKHYITVFAHQHEEIYAIRAVATNGFVLAEYIRVDPTRKFLKRSYCIERGNRTCMIIELTHDLGPLQQKLSVSSKKDFLASTFFAAAMAVFLWYVLRKKAFIPLETALEELHRTNAGLEEKVAARTAEWVRANTDLKNEIAEREAAQRELVIKDLAIATSVNGMSFISLDGTLTYANSSSLLMWGYQNPDEVVGRSVLDFWQSRETAARALQYILTTGFWFGELVAMRKDGSFFDVQVSADVVKDADGHPICIMASILDITERKQAEQRLRESESKFKSFSEQAIVGIYLMQDDKIKYTNPRFIEMFGYAVNEFPANAEYRQFVHPGDVHAVEERFKKRLAGQIPTGNFQFRGVKKNGETIYLEVFGSLIEYEGRPAAVGTVLDITERVLAAEELKKSEAKHRMVVENISEIIYSMTVSEGRLQGTIDFLSGSVKKTVGYAITDFLRDPGLWLSLIHPDDLSRVKEETRRMVRDRMETTRVYRFRHRDTEKYLWLEDRIVPRVDGGNVIGYFGVARDITRRKQAEDGLKDALIRAEEEKNKSEAIIAAIGDGIGIQDRDFRVLYQNSCHREFVGEHVGEHCYRAYHKREEVCAGCPVALSYMDGKVHITERSRMTEAGLVYFEVSASPLRDASGEIVAGIELVRNITDRKRAEEDVRRAYETQYVINALLRISLEGRSMDEVLLKALDIILSSSWYVSKSKGAIFLTEREGRDLLLKVHRGFDRSMQDACSRVAPGTCLCGRAAQSGSIQFASHLDDRHEIRFEGISAHGHYCVPIGAPGNNAGVLSLCLEDGHPYDAYEQEFLSAVSSALTGIVQRKRMEEERERMISDLQALLDKVSVSRLEWQETFDSITDMISIHDEDYRIIKANKAFAGRFGLTPRDVIHKKCYELFHHQHSPVPECPHRKTLEGSGPHTEEIADPASGRIFLISTFPFFSAESRTRGVVHIARDITEARENEARLMMNERLAALGKMASGIAHEINNPLAAIAGCVDGMNRRIGRGEYDQELFKKYLAIMKEELTRSKNITTSMLSFVQKKDYEKKPFRIHEAVLKSLEIIGYQGRLKNVTVTKKMADGTPVIHGSEGELKQVFLIILTNALDAMDDKGALAIETSINGQVLTITVTDTGPGIPPENLSRIFDPFFTTKSERGGTGLGLSIANRIIAAHNGRIRVSSAGGSGATVTIEFPL